jgi:peroxiredoxin
MRRAPSSGRKRVPDWSEFSADDAYTHGESTFIFDSRYTAGWEHGMTVIASVLMLWTMSLPAEAYDRPRENADVETVRRLSDEFDLALRAASDAASGAKTDEDRAAARRANPNPREYARKFLDLARDAKNEPATIDALIWVVRHAGRTPECDEAVRQIGDRYIRSDRIAGACLPIAARARAGEDMLRRIFEQNPSAEVRGQACLGLVFAQRKLLLDVRQYRRVLPEQRAKWVKAYGRDRVDQLEKSDPDMLVVEAENWLERVLGEFPRAVVNKQVSDFFPLLAGDLGIGAERVLRRAAEAHPDAMTRREAECALLNQQMKLASVVAHVVSAVAGAETSPGVEDVAGGEKRLKAIDPSPLALEIGRRLRELAEHANEVAEPEANFYLLVAEIGSNQAYHKGAELLLRRVANGHPDRKIRPLARRSLVFYLVGMAGESSRLRFAAGPDLAYWVALLGEVRVAELRKMDPALLTREAGTLAEQVATESRDLRGAPDRAIEELRQKLGRTTVGMIAPEIEGSDLDGNPFKLSAYRGRVVVLDFWNHRTCPHCREAYPKLRELAKGFSSRPFALLGVDSDDERDELARVVKEGAVTWRFWFTHGTKEEPTFLRWNIQGVPNVILLDHRGVIRARYEGTPGLETLKQAVGALVKEAENAAESQR